MPSRKAADPNLIRETYERTGSGRETARILGLHENTIYAALRRMRGKCLRCHNFASVGKKYCPDCLTVMAARMKERRAERRRLGICAECDDPVAPPSRTFCAKHRLARVDHTRERDKQRRELRRGTHQGEPNPRQRLRSIRERYGHGGVEAWLRDGAACVICGVAYGDATIQLHHRDLDKTNNVASNFACLCFDCHQLVHGFLRSRAPRDAVLWVQANYPDTLASDAARDST